VDMIASAGADHFRRAIEVLLAADDIDGLIVLYIDVALTDPEAIVRGITTGVAVARKRKGTAKPVYACVMASAVSAKAIAVDGERIPNFAFPELPARVFSKLARYAEWRNRPEGMLPEFDDIRPNSARSLCQSILHQRGSGWLSNEEIRDVLAAFALPFTSTVICRSADEAAKTAEKLGFPVAVKLASSRIVHKTEFGGVQLNLENEAAVRQAFAAIQDRLAKETKLDAMDGVSVQSMISRGVELMIGVIQDPSFGPLIGFGLGGIHVEILRDVCFRVTPITDQDAKEMVRSIRGYPLLEGYRGHPPADIAAIEDLLLRVARLVEEVPEISELDFNPVFALGPGQGCSIVDARIRVESLERTQK
jgi:acetate---CoA ligase (ADP-forming)